MPVAFGSYAYHHRFEIWFDLQPVKVAGGGGEHRMVSFAMAIELMGRGNRYNRRTYGRFVLVLKAYWVRRENFSLYA